jgi:hypothetical protein
MENSLSPNFVQIHYQSPFAPHVMTIPTVPLTTEPPYATVPSFQLRGLELPVDVNTAILALIAVLKTQWLPTTRFVNYTLFSQPGVGDVPVPVWSAPIGVNGTNAGAGVNKATQRTWTWRADDFTLFRQVHLDVPMTGEFDKITDLSGDATAVAINDYVTALATWIASRGGGRPNTFLSITETLNEKLRRSYRMT